MYGTFCVSIFFVIIRLIICEAIIPEYEAVSDGSASLPCNITIPRDPGVISLILWYKDADRAPIYTLDFRGVPPEKAKHFPSKNLRERSHFDVTVYPPVLKLDPVYVDDQGIYKCSIEYGRSRRVTRTVKLKILSEKPLETEIPTVEVVTSVLLTILPNLQHSKSNDSLIKNLSTNHSIIISDQQPHSVNNSVEDNLERDFAMDNSTEKEDAIVTDATVNSSCSCTYIVEDRDLLAHDGQMLVKYGDKILGGTTITFYCNTTGYFRLKGVPSLQCPLDCVWHLSMFPFCVRPKEEDIIIRVDAVPPQNMKIDIGGVLSVVPGTKLELKCRVNAKRKQRVDWSIPSSGGFKYPVESRRAFEMMYVKHEVSPNNSGSYTCYTKHGGSHHSVDIQVDGENPPETEIPTVEVVTSVRVPLTIRPNLQLSKSNDSLIKKLSTNHSITISGQQPHSVNNSVEDNLEGDFVIDNSTEKEDAVVTDATVNSSCSCTYFVEDRDLLAHDGQKLVKYGDKILSGTIIAFYCNTTGYFRLRGLPSLQCPLDCIWHSSMFPSCVDPKEEDIIIRVVAVPPENMKTYIGGVFSVVPGTRLELMCRVNVKYKQHVDWSIRTSGGVKYSVESRRVFKLMYVINEVSPNNSGRYTCYVMSTGSYQTVDIQVDDVECPEIESSEGLVISYSPNRNFNGRAIFNCSEPYMRNGSSHIICMGSGVWSEPPASCHSPTCLIGNLYDVIPDGVVPLVNADTEENVPLGNELQLGCDGKGTVLKGNNTVICSAMGIWRTGDDIECIKGCSGLLKKNDSELQISPKKEFYSVGESIIFSCPEGKHLTTDVERILCFSSGWTPNNIPDCQ